MSTDASAQLASVTDERSNTINPAIAVPDDGQRLGNLLKVVSAKRIGRHHYQVFDLRAITCFTVTLN